MIRTTTLVLSWGGSHSFSRCWELLDSSPRPANTVALRESRADSAIVASPAFSDKELGVLPTSGWLKNGGNLFNQNYSPLTQINSQNVETRRRSGVRIWMALG